MRNIMIAGAGKIGSAIAALLAKTEDYQVYLADTGFSGHDAVRILDALPQIKTVSLDIKDCSATEAFIINNNIIAIISSLPYFLNIYVASAARAAKVHYFDLTEDIATTAAVKKIAADASTAFVPQCGLAPGFVSIVANDLLSSFESCDQAKLRVGALPQNSNNALHYSLSWSIDGLINEYANSCHAIEAGLPAILTPLEGLESIEIDGCKYEAFNTSGGLGGLNELYLGKVRCLNYKTIRYPGHCEKMRFLMYELNLNADRNLLKSILEKSIPKTYQDIVLIYISAQGIKYGEFIEQSYVKKIYSQIICGIEWSAIQLSTAAGVCAVVDLVLGREKCYQGFILQENFALSDILANRFGRYFA